MAQARWQQFITDDDGNVQANASIVVRREATGTLAFIYSDRDGAVPKGNPFNADANGYAFFHAAGGPGPYRITATKGGYSATMRYVPVGLLAEADAANSSLLANTAVSPNTYGTSNTVGRFTVDQQGRLTSATSVPVVVRTGNIANNAVTSLKVDSTVAKLDTEDQTLSGGARVTEKNLGVVNSGTLTPDPGDRPLQRVTANGAFTLSPGSNQGAYMLTIVNGAAAGAITTSGWTKKSGDNFTTTNGHKFRCHCSIGADGSLLVVQAMQ